MSLCYNKSIIRRSGYSILDKKNNHHKNKKKYIILHKNEVNVELDGEKRRDYIYSIHLTNSNVKLKNWCLNIINFLDIRGNWKRSDVCSNLDFVILNQNQNPKKNKSKIVHNIFNYNMKLFYVKEEKNFLPITFKISDQNLNLILIKLEQKYKNKWFLKRIENLNKYYGNLLVVDKNENDIIDISHLINNNYVMSSNFVMKCYSIVRITKNYKCISIYKKVSVHLVLKNEDNLEKSIVLDCVDLVGEDVYKRIIYPQIEKIIKTVIRLNMPKFEEQDYNYFFQLLTFKIILDKDMKCWLHKVCSGVPNISSIMFDSFHDERYHKATFLNSVIKTCIDPVFTPLLNTNMKNLFVKIYKKNHIIENIVKNYIMPKINFSNGEDITLLRYKHQFNELMISYLKKSNLCPKHYVFSIYDKRLLDILEEFKKKYKIMFLKPYSGQTERKISGDITEIISWISKNEKKCKQWAVNEYINNPMLFYINGKRPSGKIYDDKSGRKNIIRVCILKIFNNTEVTTYMYNKKILLVSPKPYNIEDNESLIANYDQINDLCKSNSNKISEDFHFNLDNLQNGRFDVKKNNKMNKNLKIQMLNTIKLVSKHFIKKLSKNIKQKQIIVKPSFHIFTYDFLIDRNTKLWLLKINSQPSQNCLQNLLKEQFGSIIKNIINIFDFSQKTNQVINNNESELNNFNKIISVKVK